MNTKKLPNLFSIKERWFIFLTVPYFKNASLAASLFVISTILEYVFFLLCVPLWECCFLQGDSRKLYPLSHSDRKWHSVRAQTPWKNLHSHENHISNHSINGISGFRQRTLRWHVQSASPESLIRDSSKVNKRLSVTFAAYSNFRVAVKKAANVWHFLLEKSPKQTIIRIGGNSFSLDPLIVAALKCSMETG